MTTTKQPTNKALMDLQDCADGFVSCSQWHGALFAAIKLIVSKAEDKSAEGLDCFNRKTVETLAAIGEHLADNAVCASEDFADAAKAMRGEA